MFSKGFVVTLFWVSSTALAASHGAGSFGSAALYLQPAFGGNGLGYTAYSNYSGNDNNGNFTGTSGAPNNMSNIFPNWKWGFQIDAAYQINTNDAVINWYHLHTDKQSTFPTGDVFSGNNDGFYAGQFQVSSTWNEIDLEFGKTLSLTEQKTVRIHGGAEFATIQNQFNNAPMLNPDTVVAYNTLDTLSYHGFGPRLGFDFDYSLVRALSIYAKGAGSVLVGTTQQANSGYQTYPYPNNPPSPFVTGNYNQSNYGVIVPEISAKLGAQYDYQLTAYTLNLDLGYMWLNYLDAIVSYAGNGIVFANIGNNVTANYTLNGLYLGIKLSENALV